MKMRGRGCAVLLVVAVMVAGRGRADEQLLAAETRHRPTAESQRFVPIGAAVVDITPSYPTRLTGYASRSADAEGVAAAIHARALAIGPAEDLSALLISVDNCGVPQTLTERVYAQITEDVPLPRERFAILATHSHSAPWLRDFAPNIIPDLPEESAERLARYEDTLEEKLVAVCRDALQSQRPGQLSLAHGEVGFAVNRRAMQDGRWIGFGETTDGPVDHRLPLLAARDEAGELIAVVANYACHCTTEPGSFNRISGDWAGCAADMLESGHPDAVALMAIGCGADANPSPGGSHELSRAHGQSLAAEVNRLLDDPSAWRPLDPRVRCELARIDLPLGHLPSREEWEAAAARGGVEGSRARFFLEMLDRGEDVPTTVPNYPVQTWCFGDDLAMVFLAGEVVVDYQKRLDGMFDRDRLWVNAYANDVPCYIASARLLREGGYEVDSSMLYYRQPTRLAPETEDLICDAVQKQLPHSFYTAALQETFPGPLEPAEAVASMVPRPGMKVVLAAAEPLICDPVAFDWDEQGRLYVVEMGDYPLAMDGRHGRVRRLSDVDGDGVYDEAVTFLDNLAYPTGIQCWRGGAIVAMAPDVLYAEDTDGDGQADLCEPVLSGFSEGNQQHRVNGLRLGLDGWLYLANGDSSGKVRATGYVPGGERREPSEPLSLRGRDLRYDPATARIELVAGTTQFARSRDDFGTWFGNNNSNPIWQYGLEDRYLRRNPHAGGISSIRQVAAVPGAAPVFPESTTLARFNDFHMADRFTSACGTIIYRDGRLGDGYAANAFISEPVHNLVSRLVMRRSDDGLGHVGERAADESDREFLASRDNWFRPTTLRTGPDGAVWVADMYRAVIEHPEWIPAEYQRKMNLAAGSDLGRIYRVMPDDGCCEAAPEGTRAFFKQPWEAIPLAELVARLQSPNGWWRDLAERLLLHRREELLADREQLAEIARLVGAGGGPGVQAVATLAALAGDAPLAELDAAVALAVASDDPRVRRAGVRFAETGLTRGDAAALSAVAGLIDDPDPAVRQQVLLSMGEARGEAAALVLAEALLLSAESADLLDAGMTSLTPQTVEAVTLAVSQAVNEERVGGPAATRLVGKLLVQAASMGQADGLAEARAALLASVDAAAAAERLELATAIIKGGRADEAVDAAARVVVAAAWTILHDADAEPQRRVAAVQLLDAAGESFASEELTDLLLAPQVGPPLQEAYLAVIASRGNAEATDRVFQRLRGLSPQVRSRFFDQLLTRPQMAAGILDRLASGSLAPLDLDVSHRNRLIGYPKESIAQRAAELLATAGAGDRADLVTRWLDEISGLAGEAASGMAVFEKRCSACHRLQDVGRDVGPDLAALTDRSMPALVAAILDPNRAVEAKYLSYSLLTTSGRLQAGLLAEETGGSVTLATAEGERVAVPRAEIDSLVCSQRSLMPEGLEQDLTPQNLADVIAFVQSAGVSWKAFEGNQPEVVRAGEDGSIVLPASAAEIYGPSLVFEPEFGNLGWWASDADSARWTVDVPHGGDWIVELDFACDDSAAGEAIRFSTGTRMLTARVPGTGSWANYQTWRVGTLDIFGGRQQITVTALQPPRSALIDLKAIRLLPPE